MASNGRRTPATSTPNRNTPARRNAPAAVSRYRAPVGGGGRSEGGSQAPLSGEQARINAESRWITDLNGMLNAAKERFADVCWTAEDDVLQSPGPAASKLTNIVYAHKSEWKARDLFISSGSPDKASHRTSSVFVSTRAPKTFAKVWSVSPAISSPDTSHESLPDITAPPSPQLRKATSRSSVASAKSKVSGPLTAQPAQRSRTTPNGKLKSPMVMSPSSPRSNTTSLSDDVEPSIAGYTLSNDQLQRLMGNLRFIYTAQNPGTSDEDFLEGEELPFENVEAVKRLQHDTLQMWTRRQDCDLALKVEASHAQPKTAATLTTSTPKLKSILTLPMEDAGEEELEGCFAVHKAILVSRSPYFADQLQGPYADRRQKTIHMPTPPFTAASLYFVLGFMYTGTLAFTTRSFDLTTAFQIWRASTYLQMDSLTALIASSIRDDFCHNFSCMPPCPACQKRVPRTLAFTAAPDVFEEHLLDDAINAMSGRYLSLFWGRELGLMSNQVRDLITKRLASRIDSDPASCIWISAEIGVVAQKLDNERSSKWKDNLQSLLEAITSQLRERLPEHLTAIIASDEWKTLLDDTGIQMEALRTVTRLLLDGITEKSATRVYQALCDDVLRAEEGTPTGRAHDVIEAARSEVLSFIRKRWLNIRGACGFDDIKSWTLKELAHELNLQPGDLLNPAGKSNASRQPPTISARLTGTSRRPMSSTISKPKSGLIEREPAPSNLRAAVLNRNATNASAAKAAVNRTTFGTVSTSTPTRPAPISRGGTSTQTPLQKKTAAAAVSKRILVPKQAEQTPPNRAAMRVGDMLVPSSLMPSEHAAMNPSSDRESGESMSQQPQSEISEQVSLPSSDSATQTESHFSEDSKGAGTAFHPTELPTIKAIRPSIGTKVAHLAARFSDADRDSQESAIKAGKTAQRPGIAAVSLPPTHNAAARSAPATLVRPRPSSAGASLDVRPVMSARTISRQRDLDVTSASASKSPSFPRPTSPSMLLARLRSRESSSETSSALSSPAELRKSDMSDKLANETSSATITGASAPDFKASLGQDKQAVVMPRPLRQSDASSSLLATSAARKRTPSSQHSPAVTPSRATSVANLASLRASVRRDAATRRESEESRLSRQAQAHSTPGEAPLMVLFPTSEAVESKENVLPKQAAQGFIPNGRDFAHAPTIEDHDEMDKALSIRSVEEQVSLEPRPEVAVPETTMTEPSVPTTSAAAEAESVASAKMEEENIKTISSILSEEPPPIIDDLASVVWDNANQDVLESTQPADPALHDETSGAEDALDLERGDNTSFSSNLCIDTTAEVPQKPTERMSDGPSTPKALRTIPLPGQDLDTTPKAFKTATEIGSSTDSVYSQPHERYASSTFPKVSDSPFLRPSTAQGLTSPPLSLSIGISCIIWPSLPHAPPRTKLRALVKYVGPVEGYVGIMVGVEVFWPLPEGLEASAEYFNDGTLNGVSYFTLGPTSSAAGSGGNTPQSLAISPPTSPSMSSYAGGSRLSAHLDMLNRAEREARKRRIARLQACATEVLQNSALSTEAESTASFPSPRHRQGSTYFPTGSTMSPRAMSSSSRSVRDFIEGEDYPTIADSQSRRSTRPEEFLRRSPTTSFSMLRTSKRLGGGERSLLSYTPPPPSAFFNLQNLRHTIDFGSSSVGGSVMSNTALLASPQIRVRNTSTSSTATSDSGRLTPSSPTLAAVSTPALEVPQHPSHPLWALRERDRRSSWSPSLASVHTARSMSSSYRSTSRCSHRSRFVDGAPGYGLFVRPDEVMWIFEDE